MALWTDVQDVEREIERGGISWWIIPSIFAVLISVATHHVGLQHKAKTQRPPK